MGGSFRSSVASRLQSSRLAFCISTAKPFLTVATTAPTLPFPTWPTGIKPLGADVEMVAIMSSPAARRETSVLTPLKLTYDLLTLSAAASPLRSMVTVPRPVFSSLAASAVISAWQVVPLVAKAPPHLKLLVRVPVLLIERLPKVTVMVSPASILPPASSYPTVCHPSPGFFHIEQP